MDKIELPPVLNQMNPNEACIDATPDGKYALRILKYYRSRCDEKWSTDTAGNCDNPIWQLMNETQIERAKELDQAINKLLNQGV
jgi:hypothetical protein